MEGDKNGIGKLILVIVAVLLAPILLIGAFLEMLLGGLFVPKAGSPEEAFQQSAEVQAMLAKRNPPVYGLGIAEIAEAEFQRNGGLACGSDYWGYWNSPAENWCCDFVYYCADQLGLVGEGQLFGPYTAWVPSAFAQLEAGGAYMFTLYEDTPQTGDIVFYYDTEYGRAARILDNGTAACHIGIVVNYEDDILRTIEGNAGTSGHLQNTVRKCVYANPYGETWAGAAVLGFARPHYTNANAEEALVSLVASFEGFSQYPIWDYSQWSVGYGTRCPDGKLSDYMIHGIPEEDARTLLHEHLQAAKSQVTAWIDRQGLGRSDAQVNALTSLTYNIGPGWLTSEGYAGFRQLIISGGSEQEIISAFAQICHAGGEVLPGLVERRICEAYLYCTGQYVTDYTATGYTYTVSGNSVTIEKEGGGT